MYGFLSWNTKGGFFYILVTLHYTSNMDLFYDVFVTFVTSLDSFTHQ